MRGKRTEAYYRGKERGMEGLIEGRIVHYVVPCLRRHAVAIVVMVHANDTVNLCVFETMPTKGTAPTYGVEGVRYDPEAGDRTWHWPEKA